MAVSFNYQQDTVTCFIKGEIDHHQSTEIRTQIDHAVGRNTPKMLILDFSGVSFMDSSGIGLVMGRYKTISEVGGELAIINTSPQIGKVMRLAGMERLAKIGMEEQINETDKQL